MEKDIRYSAFFVLNKKELLEMFPPQHSKIFAHHSTNEFTPHSLENIEIGKRNHIKILGRAVDEKGDVLLVENPKSENTFPHITLSCAEGVDAVYSNELLQKAVENKTIEYFNSPKTIAVVEGYKTVSGEVFPNLLSELKD